MLHDRMQLGPATFLSADLIAFRALRHRAHLRAFAPDVRHQTTPAQALLPAEVASVAMQTAFLAMDQPGIRKASETFVAVPFTV